MNKNERIEAALKGKKVDKIPFSFWTHLPKIDLDPELLAENTFEFYNTYNLDFIKTMNNGMYAIEDFNCICDFSEITKGGIAKVIEFPINKIEDWKKIIPQSVYKGALARELLSLKLLVKKVNDKAPIVFTVFSPLTIANKLSNNLLIKHIKHDVNINNLNNNLIHKALSAITKTTANLVEKSIELGASGVFFASQMSSFDFLSENEYKEYGVKYDLQVLESASKGWFNILHIHGNNIMFDLLKDYPVQAINWHVWETAPDLKEARGVTNKCLMGGIIRKDLTENNKLSVYNHIYKSIEQSKGHKHILTPGCVIRYPLNNEILVYAKEAKSNIEKKIF